VHLHTFELVSDKNFSLHVDLLSIKLAVCEVNFVHSKLCMIEKNEMGGACGAYGGGKKCAQGSGGEA
jgi:hypothetical protein